MSSQTDPDQLHKIHIISGVIVNITEKLSSYFLILSINSNLLET